MTPRVSRRSFLQGAGAAGLGLAAAGCKTLEGKSNRKRRFGISLAGWSLHRSLGQGEGQIPMVEMPKLARDQWDIEAIELVSGMMPSADKAYLDTLSRNAAEANVAILLVMVDGQGDVGSPDGDVRRQAVENHRAWIDIAEYLGCHSIRMNWTGAPHEVVNDSVALENFIDRSVAPFQSLCQYGDKKGINVLIENHWGPSSYPDSLLSLMERVDHPRFGTLPDFGNFPEDVNRYEAVDRMMPYARAVSAKCYDFDPATGMETRLDYPRLIETVVDKHGYRGYIGIEYEGNRLSEYDGIRAGKTLLERLRDA